MALIFQPLYWVYHDFWKYESKTWARAGSTIKTTTNSSDHLGHMHFFIPGFYSKQQQSQQAYTGKQTYNFNLEQLWSPNSKDLNQQYNFKVIGKPKWYFYIEQYWRRIYIQDWDYKTNSDSSNFMNKKGIKYDASLPQHTKGIFRQTKDNYFFYTDLCRTLPIEYWKNEDKTIRDHYLRYNNQSKEYKAFYEKMDSVNWKKSVNEISKPTWDFSNDYPTLKDDAILPQYNPIQLVQYTDFYSHYDQFTIPAKAIVESIANYASSELVDVSGLFNVSNAIDQGEQIFKKPTKEKYFEAFGQQSGARVSSYPDRYYIYPIIEYQKVIQKNYERPDGWEDRDIEDEQTGEQFGDSNSYTITIPYQKKTNGKSTIQSPFSDDNGKVYPAGQYQHGVVKEEDKLKMNLVFKQNGQPYFNNYEIQFLYNKPRDTWHMPMIDDLSMWNGDKQMLFKNLEDRIPTYYKKHLDGMWVQQCLGAMVKAKVKIITEDQYGGRTTHWVTTTNFQSSDIFVGKQVL